MENSRFWLFLGLGLTAMLSMKYIASPDSSFGHWKSGWHTAYDADDGSIDSRRLHAHGGGTPRPHPILAGLTSSMRHTTSASLAPVDAAKTAKKVDPKKDDKKKKDEKKKKKTKKADINGGVMQAPAEETSESKGASKSRLDSSTDGYAGAAAPQAPSYAAAAAVAGASAKTKTLQDWEELLIANPSYAETVTFIKAYQAKTVTSTIFYAIVKEMMASKTEVLNQYGVMALQATPSVTSLTMLAAATSTDSKITTQINTALAAYETLSYLPVLKTALSTTVTTTTLPTLLSLVTASAQKNLTATAGASTGTNETAQGGVAATTKAAYEALLAQLQALELKETDSTSQQAIATAVNTIKALGISTTTTAVVAEANREFYQSNWR